MDLPCTQLMGEPPEDPAPDPERRAFEQSVFGSLVGADADGRKERVSRNPLRFLIRGGPNKIGRDPTQCQIVIENQTLSRVHAVLEVVRDERGEPSYLIRDENSSNRSFRNGVQMRSGAMYVLEGGEQLRFGEVRFVFQVSGQEEEDEEEEDEARSLEDAARSLEDAAEEILPPTSESTLVCQTPTPNLESPHNRSSVSAVPVKTNTIQVPETPMGPPARALSPSSGMGTPIGVIPESPSITPSVGSLNGSASFVASTQPAEAGHAQKTRLALSEIFEQETQAISVGILDLPTQQIEASRNILDEDTQKIPTEDTPFHGTNGVSSVEASGQISESETNDNDQVTKNNGVPRKGDNTAINEEEDVFNVATQESVVDRDESFDDNQDSVPQGASESQSSNPASPTLKHESPTQPVHASEDPMNTNSSPVSVEKKVREASNSNDGNESDVSENLLAVCETDGDVALEETSSQGPSSSTPVKQTTSSYEEDSDDVATQILAEDDDVPPFPSHDSNVELTDKRVLTDFSELMNSSTTSGIASTAYLDQSASTLETTETLADTRIINSMSSEGPDQTLDNGPSNGDHGVNDKDIKSDESSDDEIIQSSQLSTNRTNFNSITMEMTKPVGKITSQKQQDPSSQSKDQIEKSTGTLKIEETPTIQAIDQEQNENSSSRTLSPDIYDVEVDQDDENQQESQKTAERPDSEPLDLPCTQVLAEALYKESKCKENEEDDEEKKDGGEEEVSNIEAHIKKESIATTSPKLLDKKQECETVKTENIQPGAEEPLRRSSRATKRSTRLSSFFSDVPEPTNRAKRNSVPLISPKTEESNPCAKNVNSVANEDSIASRKATEQKTPDDVSVKISAVTVRNASENGSKQTARKKRTTKPKKSKASVDSVDVGETSGTARKENSLSVSLNIEMKETGTTIPQGQKSKRSRATPMPPKTIKLEPVKNSSPVRLEDSSSLSGRRAKKRANDETSRQAEMENSNPGAEIDQSELQDQKVASFRKRPARRSSSNSIAKPNLEETQTPIKPENSTKKTPKRLRSSLRSSAISSAGVEDQENNSKPRSSQRTSRQLRNQTVKQSIVPQKKIELPTVADMLSKNESETKATQTVRKVEESVASKKGSQRGSPVNSSVKKKATNTLKRHSKETGESMEQDITGPGLDERVEVKRLSRRKTGQAKDQSKENKSAPTFETSDVDETAVVPGRSTRSTLRRKQAQPKAMTSPRGNNAEVPSESKARLEKDADLGDPKTIGNGSCPKQSLKRANKRANSIDQMEGSVGPYPKKSRNVTAVKKVETRRESTSSVESVSLRQRGEIKVMFTGYEDSKDQKIVSDLGGSITESLDACTVLVTDKIRRTAKFLCMVARGMPIVSPMWLHSSKESRTFQDPWSFLVTDRNAEKKWDFVLQTTLRNARTKEHLLSGFKIYATKSVMPSGDQLKEIVESAGGQVLKKLPKRVSDQVIVIACAKDHMEALAARERGFQVSSNEIILTGFLRHKLDFKAHQLKL